MLGYAAITVASIMWSLNPAVVSRFRAFIKPFTYTALRAVAAILFLTPVVTLGGIGIQDGSLSALIVIVLSAIIGPGLGDALYTKSIQLIGGSLAVLISYTYIFVAQVVAAVAIGEPLRYTLIAGSMTAFAGIAVALLRSEETSKLDLKGLACAVGAAILWGAATVMIKIALAYADTLSLTFVRLLVIAITFFPLGLALEGLPPRTHMRPLLIASSITGVLGWGIGMYLFVYSIFAIGVSATAIATALTPVLSQMSTKLIAGEKPRLRQVLGALLISIGIFLSMF